MKGLFGYDGALINFFGKIADCVILSLLWLVCSLPVITMGAATAAMYHAIYKSMRQGYGGIWANFWEGFRDNFKQGTVIWLLLLVLYGVLAASAWSAYLMLETGMSGVLPLILLAIVAAVVTMWAQYLLPSAARFHAETKQILKACAAVALLNLFWSIALLAVLVAVLVLISLEPLSILVLPGVGMYISSLILEHYLPKYAAAEEDAAE